MSIAVCIMTVLQSCIKNEGIPTESTYTFINQTDKPVTVDLYGSKEDYGVSSNRIKQYAIEPGAAQKMLLEVAKPYWVDWYSADYSYNNWELSYSSPTPFPELAVAAVDDTRVISIRSSDTVWSVVFNGGDATGKWKGILSSSSHPLAGTHEFRFRKTMTGEHIFTDLSGAATSQEFTYQINGISYYLGKTSRFNLYLRNLQSAGIFSISCNMFNMTPNTGRDALKVQTLQPTMPSVEFNLTRQ